MTNKKISESLGDKTMLVRRTIEAPSKHLIESGYTIQYSTQTSFRQGSKLVDVKLVTDLPQKHFELYRAGYLRGSSKDPEACLFPLKNGIPECFEVSGGNVGSCYMVEIRNLHDVPLTPPDVVFIEEVPQYLHTLPKDMYEQTHDGSLLVKDADCYFDGVYMAGDTLDLDGFRHEISEVPKQKAVVMSLVAWK